MLGMPRSTSKITVVNELLLPILKTFAQPLANYTLIEVPDIFSLRVLLTLTEKFAVDLKLFALDEAEYVLFVIVTDVIR